MAAMAKIIKRYDGQVIILINDSAKTFIKTCESLSFTLINLDSKQQDLSRVSMKIKTRNYVKHTDLSKESKVELSTELLYNALRGKENPILAWSGGKDSTAALLLAEETGLLKPIRIVRINTLNEYPQQHRYNMQIEQLLKDKITYDISVFKDGCFTGETLNGLLRPDTTIWNIIKNKGFPLLPKEMRQSTVPYFDAVMKHCRIVVNECCEDLKEAKARQLYKTAGVDLIIRGMTGKESKNRKRHIVLGGYTRYVKYYNSTVCDCIGFWSDEDVIEYVKSKNVPLCPIYELNIPRNGCLVCAKNILQDNNSIKLLRQHYPKVWNHLMVNLGLAREILKLQYIIRKARGLGLKKGDPQMELDDFDINYLNNIDMYESFDLSCLLSQQPCRCDNI
jgi:3'-phosphoadenosine 5'-phosphosulfate sulfotransferase (PAPS reductase)/FAD synthetase